jgi:hypothetical protein
MDRTIKIFLIMAVIAVTMEATGRFTIIPDESNTSVIMTGMAISRIPGSDVVTGHSLFRRYLSLDQSVFINFLSG